MKELDTIEWLTVHFVLILGETRWEIYGKSLYSFVCLFVCFCNFPESLKLVETTLMTSQKPFWQFSEHPCQKVNELSQDSQSNCKIHPGSWCKGCLSKKVRSKGPQNHVLTLLVCWESSYWKPFCPLDSSSMANKGELSVSLETKWALSLLNAGRVSQIAPEIFSNKSIFLILVTFLLILLTQLQEQSNQNSAMIKSVLTSWLQLCPPCNFFVTVSVLFFNGWRTHVIT